MVAELLSARLHGKATALIFQVRVNDLKMTELVQKHIVKHITTHRFLRPLCTTLCSELSGRLTTDKKTGKTDTRR